MKDGTSHGMGLGSLELVTLAEARDKALLCRKMLLDGIDPLAGAPDQAGADAARRGEQDHLPHLRRALHRGARARLAQRQASPTVAEHPRELRLSGDRRSARGRGRHRSGAPDSRADLDHQDRDGFPAARPDREHPGLGDGTPVPPGRESGAVARAPRPAAAGARQGGAGQSPRGPALRRAAGVHGASCASRPARRRGAWSSRS